MSKYIGVKEVVAAPMTRGEHSVSKGFDKVLTGSAEDEGYQVIYADGYESWSPEAVFKVAYRLIEETTFGLAIEALRKGRRVARKGWNGKGMYIVKQVDSDISADIVPKMQSLPQTAKDTLYPNGISYRNQMIIINQDGVANSWVASSSDTFAEDWVILD